MKNTSKKNKILIVTGDTSGDLHAAHLVKALKERNAHLQFVGVGGYHLSHEGGVPLIQDIKALSVIGLPNLYQIIILAKTLYKIAKLLHSHQAPNMVVLLDYSGFNLRVAKIAKRANIKVLYYISPQIWAWRQKRIKLIKQYVDHMAVILPFEVDFYRQHDVKATYVGHPLVHQLPENFISTATFHTNKTTPIIALMPGSRKKEIQKILPTLLKAADMIHQIYPKSQWILPLSSNIKASDIHLYIQHYAHLSIRIVDRKKGMDFLKPVDLVWAASGTTTLELTLLNIPMIIVYKISPISFWVIRRLTNVVYIGLCNLLANKLICPELIQSRFTEKNLIKETLHLLKKPLNLKKMKENLKDLKKGLGRKNASQCCASIIFDLLNNS